MSPGVVAGSSLTAQRTGEHAVSDAGQIVLGCVFAATWITDTFFFSVLDLPQSVRATWRQNPFWSRFVGSIGLPARTGLSIVFGEERERAGVIRKSVFSVVRHPVYLSEILLYLGLLMLSISLAAEVVRIIAIGFLHCISRYEERPLLARFGEEYELHMGKCQHGSHGFGRDDWTR